MKVETGARPEWTLLQAEGNEAADASVAADFPGLDRGEEKAGRSLRIKRIKYICLILLLILAAACFSLLALLLKAGHMHVFITAAGVSGAAVLAGIYLMGSGLRIAGDMQSRMEDAESMLEGSGVPVVAIGPDHGIIFHNSVASDVHGELKGKKCYQALKSQDSPCPGCKLSQVIEQERVVSVENSYLDRRGEEQWYRVTMAPIKNGEGVVKAVSHTAVSIQDKKALELELSERTRALQESETKYKNYMSNAADAILITDLDFKILEYNTQMSKLAGLNGDYDIKENDLFGSGIIPVGEHERIRDLTQRMLNDRHPRQFEMELIKRNGQKIAVETRSTPVFVDGQAFGVQSIFRDITERKREELEKNLLISISQSIKEAPDLFSLGRSALSGICTMMGVPAAGLFMRSQDSNELKIIAEQNLKKSMVTELAINSADWSANGIASRNALLKRTIFVPDVEQLKLSSATRKKISSMGMKTLISVPLLVEGKLKGGIILMSRDINDFNEQRQAAIKQVANELAMGIVRQRLLDIVQEKNRELIEKNRELENTSMQLLQSEKMASIGQLASGVAHEINNPISYISSNLHVLDEYREELLSAFNDFKRAAGARKKSLAHGAAGKPAEQGKAGGNPDPEELFREFTDIITECKEGTQRVKNIIKNLKEFSHPDSGDLELFDLHKGINGTVNIVWNEIKYKAELVKEFGEVPQIKGYPQELNQVFMNLLVNAAQAMTKRGEIKIKTFTQGDKAVVQVTDSGCGIPGETLKRIFDPFFTTKEVGKGTGLGLSISYGIVKKHGGEIEVHSRPGQGTTFTIYLPVCGPEDVKEAS